MTHCQFNRVRLRCRVFCLPGQWVGSAGGLHHPAWSIERQRKVEYAAYARTTMEIVVTVPSASSAREVGSGGFFEVVTARS